MLTSVITLASPMWGACGLRVNRAPINVPSDPGGEAPGLDVGTLIYDGGFTATPTFSNQGNGKKATVKTGNYAKLLYSIGAPTVGDKYTLEADPDFSLLSLTGKLGMMGFAFKQGNNYHGVGLRGDGDTGLKLYRVHGTNFSTLKAGTEIEGVAPANGTQAGPNWHQIQIGASTYTYRTSADGISWTDELTNITPTPLSSVADATDFGPFLYLDASDTGTAVGTITVWEQATA
jgi:hypothetical protein